MIIDITISIIFGIIVTIALFYFVGMKNNVLYHGPNSKDVKSTVYKTDNGKCYMFEPKIYLCK
jgi:hypothetical protein